MRVFVGLSGGVDSAVSAALLQEQGHEVVGAFIRIWQPAFGECAWRRDRLDAMRVAAHLRIPFREIDLSKEYEESVVRGLLQGYAAGRTPNPDIECNRSIKFGAFATWAFGEGADAVATGHYARRGEWGSKPTLMRGVDTGKDQSYFLWRIGEEVLARTYFPVGIYQKSQVRAFAKRYKLPVATKPDSQGICFIGNVPMDDFLARMLKTEPGDVLSEHGRVIGSHRGAACYTLGQRHGFTIHDAAAAAHPHYIIKINPEANTIIVSPRIQRARRLSTFLDETVFMHGQPSFKTALMGVARYRGEPAACHVATHRDGTIVTFDEPQLVVPGQSLVLYEGERVVGGGIIRWT